ncbi:MAG: HAD family hydrolase [Anaerolineales bacterium]|nr:HAD family hydrolase [Anaerolineales bacterium]
MNAPSPLKAIFYDLGNTLLYFDGAWPEVQRRADAQLLAHLQDEGLTLDAPSFLQEFRARLNAYYAQREAEFVEQTTAYVLKTLLADLGYPDIGAGQLTPALRALYAASQAHWLLEDDTLATLEALKAAGYKLAIISNAGDDEDVQTLVDKAALRPYFELVLSSAACGVRKPNPRIFSIALEQLAVQASEAAMVGDTLGADILGANNAGIFSIWLTRRADTPANREHAQTITPNAQIPSLVELPSLIKEIAQPKLSG